ncbi:MAG TPA: RimK/LysX family protein [Phycisphaerae bacterium]|nr:RimK/LysX family protein [Phycisphaerae bacterium]
MREHTGEKTVVGWREYVSLPDWEVGRVRAKIDTGARTSAIHVGEIQELEDGRIRFEVVMRERPSKRIVWVEATPVRNSRVKPSSGVRQSRRVVRTRLSLGGVEREIELSLVCRKGMLCRMLIGRTALADRFMVDPARRYVASRRSRAKAS